MKFQKVNDNVIRCIISQEEMNEKGVKIDDLMDNRSKAEEFLRDILKEAHEELDFQTSGEALNVQLSIMKDGDVLLMISDDQSAVVRTMLDQLKERLKDFQKEMKEKNVSLGPDPNHPERGYIDEDGVPHIQIPKEDSVNPSAEQKKEPIKLPIGGKEFDLYSATKSVLEDAKDGDVLQFSVWAELKSLDNCMRLAKALLLQGDVMSKLYKLDDTYYLLVDMLQTKMEIAHNVFALAEYSDNMYMDGSSAYGVMEHGDVLIENNAITVLAEL